MPNKYISIINNGSNALYIKDAEARLDIQDIKLNLTGAMFYVGKLSVKPVEGSIEGPWTIDGITYDHEYFEIITGGEAGLNYVRYPKFDELLNGDWYYAYVLVNSVNNPDKEKIVYATDSSLTTESRLYKKDNNTFVYIGESGGYNISTIHSRGANTADLQFGAVAVYKDSVASRELEYIWGTNGWSEFGSTGSLKALAFKDNATGSVAAAGNNASSLVTFESGSGSNFVTGFDTNPVAPSFTEGAFSAGSLPSFTEGTFTQGTLPSLGEATTGTFATEGITMTYVEGTETLVFGTANTSSAVTAQGTFNAGTLPTKAADSFNAGSLPSKSADTFSAGTVPTLATAKALTASDTGTAAAQTFTGTAVSVTVS